MKVLFINVPGVEENSEFGQFCKTVIVPLLRRNFDLVKQSDTEVTFRFSRWGSSNMDAFMFSYIDHLNEKHVFHAAAQAEKEGFDGIFIGCFGDPMLWEIRQACNIPVVGAGESSMLLSTIMGYKFGVVTISPYNTIGQEERIAKYGLKDRLVGIRSITETSEEQNMALIDAHHSIESFKTVARELIADGAEIIIPGCVFMSPALRLAVGAEEDYPNGFTEVDGVPIADVLGDTIKLLEILVSLKGAGSSWISRKMLYAHATPQAIEGGQMVLKDEGPGFWDC